MIFILKKIVDYGSWVLFSTFFIFSLLFIVTEGLVPGNRFFGTKLGLEKAVILASSVLNKQVDLQINFVGRRYTEFARVINSKYSSESLTRLDGQIVETGNAIAQIKDLKERKAAASKYVVQLSYISSGLEQEKVKMVNKNVAYVPPHQVVAENPVISEPTQIQPINNTNSSPPPTDNNPDDSISTQIDSTQETIEETIEEMEEIQHNIPAPIIEDVPPPTVTPEKKFKEGDKIIDEPGNNKPTAEPTLIPDEPTLNQPEAPANPVVDEPTSIPPTENPNNSNPDSQIAPSI